MTTVSRNILIPPVANAAPRSWQPAGSMPAGIGLRRATARTWSARLTRVWVAAMILGSVGCTPYQLAHRTLQAELAEYPRVTDGRLACQQYQRWAKREWQMLEASGEAESHSSDYASGFLQGFVDQVYAGGHAQAPAMPPRKYWRIGYRNEHGKAAIQDWYNGFAHGARVAKDKGYRERAVIPSSLLVGEDGQATEVTTYDDWNGAIEGSGEFDSTEGPTPAEPIPAGGHESIIGPAADELPAPSPAAAPTGNAQVGGWPIIAAGHDAEPAGEAVRSTAESDTNRPGPPRLGGSVPASPLTAAGSDPNRETPSDRAQPVAPTTEGDLPPETANDLPPPPPWAAGQSSATTSRSRPADGAVRPASAIQAAEGPNRAEAGAEFDPFAGSSFQPVLRPAPAPAEGSGMTTEPVPLPATQSSEATVPTSIPDITAAAARPLPGNAAHASTSSIAAASFDEDTSRLPTLGPPIETMLPEIPSWTNLPLLTSGMGAVPIAPWAPTTAPGWGLPSADAHPAESRQPSPAPADSLEPAEELPPAPPAETGWQPKSAPAATQWKSKQ